MDNSVVLCTVSYTNIVILWYVSRCATVFSHFSVGLVSVFLHFTEIYPNETKISLVKIAVFRNYFGEIRTIRAVYDALLFIRHLYLTHLVYDALLYLTHIVFFVQYIHNLWIFLVDFCAKCYICVVFFIWFLCNF